MIKKFNEYWDPNEDVRNADDIEYLEQILKYIDDDLERFENPQNFKVKAMMNRMTPEAYVEILKRDTLITKDIAEKRLKELKRLNS